MRIPVGKRRRRWLRVGGVLFVLWWCAGFASAWIATSAQQRPMPDVRRIAGVPVENVVLVTRDGIEIGAWYAPGDGERAVVLASGIFGSRSDNLGRAEFYLRRGYGVLLPDLRATGESGGTRASFGWHEAKDLCACAEFLRGRGVEAVGLHGWSLGAAAAIYAHKEIEPAWLILEAPYRDIRTALANRLWFLPWQRVSLWPLEVCTGWLAAVDADELRPIDAISSCLHPTLILGGDRDEKALPSELRELFAASPSPLKALRWIEGAGHTNLHRSFQAEVEQHLEDFLSSF